MARFKRRRKPRRKLKPLTTQQRVEMEMARQVAHNKALADEEHHMRTWCGYMWDAACWNPHPLHNRHDVWELAECNRRGVDRLPDSAFEAKNLMRYLPA